MPVGLTATRQQSTNEIIASWPPVDLDLFHGNFMGYKLHIQLTEIGGDEPSIRQFMELDFHPNLRQYIFSAEPAATYVFSLAYRSSWGIGPYATAIGGK